MAEENTGEAVIEDPVVDDAAKVATDAAAAKKETDDEMGHVADISDKGDDDKEGDKEDPKEEDKEGPKEEDKEEEEGKAYITVDNAEVMSVIDILKDLNVSREKSEEIFNDAFASGDIKDVDVKELERTVGKNVAGMMLKTLQGAQDSEAAATEAATQAVYIEAGGKDQWDAASVFAKAHYSEQEAGELNAMFQAGGKQAKLATQEVMKEFKKSAGYEEPAKLEKGGSARKTSTGTALDQREYYSLIEAENGRKTGPRQSVLQTIERRREAGRKIEQG